MRLQHLLLVVYSLLLLQTSSARGGMAVPLPTDFKASDLTNQVGRMMRLEPDALLRLRTISFFVLGFLIAACGFQKLWNYLQHDFTKLPRLTYGKALGLVFLWGLLFVVVLTMIAGARELMTPGAWKKQGYTYKLAAPNEAAAANTDAARRQGLEKLRTALWQFAAMHQGKFPSRKEQLAIAAEVWEVPGTRARYHYVEGKSAGYAPSPLVYEPELDSERRLVLLVNGDIVPMSTADIEKTLKPERL